MTNTSFKLKTIIKNIGFDNKKEGLIQGLMFNNMSSPMSYTKSYTKKTNNGYDSYSNTQTQCQRFKKLSLNRFEMNLSMQTMKKLQVQNNNVLLKDGYLYLEIKEQGKDDYNNRGEKNPRYIVFKHFEICKLLLLEPKSYVDSEVLQKITIPKRDRVFSVEQTNTNTYLFKLKVVNPENPSTAISSTVEINPEDILFIKIYLKV